MVVQLPEYVVSARSIAPDAMSQLRSTFALLPPRGRDSSSRTENLRGRDTLRELPLRRYLCWEERLREGLLDGLSLTGVNFRPNHTPVYRQRPAWPFVPEPSTLTADH